MPADRTTWQTPRWVVEKLVAAYGPLLLDPCTAPDNPLNAREFFTETDDGLAQPWRGRGDGLVFVNWPYCAKNNPVWADKVQSEARYLISGETVAALVPVSPSTRWWQTLRPDEYHFLPKRLAHIDPDTGVMVNGSNFSSAVLVWTPALNRNPFGLDVVLAPTVPF